VLQRQKFITPNNTKIYAVGDIHGRFDLLCQLLDLIVYDRQLHDNQNHLVIFLGDYIDRGCDSYRVVEELSSRTLDETEIICLKGNHEAWLLQFLANPAIGSQWFQYGGLDTLESYGVKVSDSSHNQRDFKEIRDALILNLPKSHLKFFQSLTYFQILGNYLFVHAGIKPGVELENQKLEDFIWIRKEFTESDADHDHMVVHGHTIYDRPEIRHNRIGIDTGAYYTNTLTCLVLSGDNRYFIQT